MSAANADADAENDGLKWRPEILRHSFTVTRNSCCLCLLHGWHHIVSSNYYVLHVFSLCHSTVMKQVCVHCA